MKVEQLEEKWYTFRRYHCKEGHIDFWTGDMIDDPNNDTRSHVVLNAFASRWRYDNNRWEKQPYYFSAHELIEKNCENLTAKQIWDYAQELIKEIEAQNTLPHHS